MAKGFTLLLTVMVLSSVGCAGTPADAVTSAEAACSVATSRVTAERQLPTAHVAQCDPVSEADSPEGYYVLALRAHCREALCGSTLMGWFAVEKATGTVYDFDVGESTMERVVGEGG